MGVSSTVLGSYGQQPKQRSHAAWMRFAISVFEQVTRPQPVRLESQLRSGPYSVCLAQTEEERRAAFRLRFRIFNLELNEGLESAYETGEDADEFDSFCDHLIVQDNTTNSVVGTYRLQTGITARRNLGYYSAREFDFTPYESLDSQMVELGRACIHPDHRKYEVLMLLWKAIARYAVDRGAHYLIGCSSLTSQDPEVGAATYESLKSMLAPEHLRTLPTEPYAFTLTETNQPVRAPKLLRSYLAVGAHVCGPPALDREFKTIDFLTLMDLNNLTPAIRKRLLGI
jgi:putative hemolysin